MTKTTLISIKKHLLEICIFLCLILPPIGVLLLLIIGSYHLHQTWKNSEGMMLTPGLFLLACMFFSSFCASIVLGNLSYFLVPALIIAYAGIYKKIQKDGVERTFAAYKWITIFAGVYFYCLYPFQEILISPTYKNYITGTALVGQAGFHDYQRLIGAAYNPNFSVTLLLLGLSFLLAECLKNIRKECYSRAAFQGVITLIFIHAVFLTGSRAGFSAMVVIFLLFLFRLNRILTFSLMIIIGLNINLILDWMPRNENLLQSAIRRKEIWKNSIQLWQENALFGLTPLGFGKEYILHFNEHIPHAHNLILGIFTEYGTLGGTAFLIVLFINVYKGIYLYFTKQNVRQLDTLLLSLPVILLTGIFDYVLFSPQIALIGIILIAYWDKYTAGLPIWSSWMLSIPRWSDRLFYKKRDW
ncbi:O-antigen ligase [Bacillus sp. Marseille-Q3570]|uniref:O-antigen ligase family protein n=1 Tax=Bacillus sp. Marseille-Q3570 TaxID=2963522 RepID=UPI0021B80C40|nr:O-antigen ligase family protein [Bacillus sp. Marseille-Q3570]